jgi:hypothetical protein
LAEALHPAFPILAFKTSWLPDQEQAIRRKEARDLEHERFLLGSAKVVQGLADPNHVQWTAPGLKRAREILAPKLNRTRERSKRSAGDLE